MRVTNIYSSKPSYEFRITPEGKIWRSSFTDSEEMMVDLDSDGDLTDVYLWSEFLGEWLAVDYDRLSDDKKKTIQKLVDEYKEENEIGNDFDEED